MMRFPRPLLATLALLLCAGTPNPAQSQSGPAGAANQIVNGSFATDLSGWAQESTDDLTSNWSSSDAGGSASSGSFWGQAKGAQLVAGNSYYTHGTVGWQCHDIEPDRLYRMSMHARVDSESTGTGTLYVRDITGSPCPTMTYVGSLPPSGSVQVFVTHANGQGPWKFVTRDFRTAPGQTRMEAGLHVRDGRVALVAPYSTSAYFDNVQVGKVRPDLALSMSVDDVSLRPTETVEISLRLDSLSANGMQPEVQVFHGGRLSLVESNCPGTVTDGMHNGQPRFRWAGIPDDVLGYQRTCVITARAKAGFTGEYPLGAEASCGECSIETALANNQQSVQMQSVAAPDVGVELVTLTAFPEPGSLVDVDVAFRNQGTAPAASSVSVGLSPTVLFVPTDSDACANFSAAGGGAAGVVLLDAGQAVSCTLRFRIAQQQMGAQLVANVTTSTGSDYNAANNDGTASTRIVRLRVNRNPDGTDRALGDGICEATAGVGDCSLRAAVLEANALGGRRTIEIPYSATPYVLDRTTCNDDEAYCGDLDIRKPMILRGEPNAQGAMAIVQGAFPPGSPARLLSVATGVSSSTIVEQLVLSGQNIAIPTTEGDGHGGLVHHGSGSLVLRDLVLRHGRAANLRHGGGLYSAAALVAEGLEVHDNSATLGAGIAIDPAAFALVEISDSNVHGNVATSTAATGGGLYVRAPSALVGLHRLAVHGNTARFGGGVALDNAPYVVMSNATISGNEASSNGGGITVFNGNLAISSSTIAYNAAAPASTTAGLGGGIHLNTGGTASVFNSILAYNTAQTTGSPPFLVPKGANCYGTLASSGYNSLSTVSNDVDCQFAAGTGDNADVAPQLAALADNGGAGPTHALTAPGQEIDRGPPDCRVFPGGAALLVDQRGRLRPADGDANGEARCDKGAYELSESARITIAKDGGGSGSLSSAPNGLFCNAACPSVSAAFPYDTEVTITASAASGSRFAGWEGDCASYGTAPCVVSAVGHVQASARFELMASSYSLDVTVSGGAGARVTSMPSGIDCPGSCSASFDATTEVSLHADPGPDSVLLGFYGAGCNGTGSPCTFAMDRNRAVTALFDAEESSLSVTMTGNGVGRVTSTPIGIDCPGDCSNDYAVDQGVTLTAQAAVGSTFQGWAGACSGGGATCVLDMDLGPHAVEAQFVLSADALFADGFE